MNLTELANLYHCDKGTNNFGPRPGNDYCRHYERYFEPLRNTPLKLLEVGIRLENTEGGQSLRMWRDYFPRVQLFAVDIIPFEMDGVTFFLGDQGDSIFLHDLAVKHGPFDIVIDDGSHRRNDQLATLAALFDHATKFYVCEDLSLDGIPDPHSPQINNWPNLRDFLKVPGVRHHWNAAGTLATVVIQK